MERLRYYLKLVSASQAKLFQNLFIVAFFLLLPSTSHSGVYKSSIDNATAWLPLQQKIDGSWGDASEVKFLYTSETVRTLRSTFNKNSAYSNGITWLENHHPSSLDSKARRILTLHAHGDDVSGDIAALENGQSSGAAGNDGWGLTSLFNGAPLDTALVLRSFAELGITTGVSEAIAYLQSVQTAVANEQGWGLTDDSAMDDLTTAIVLQGIIPLKGQYPTLLGNISLSVTALTSRVGSGASNWIKAHTAMALLMDDIASVKGLQLLNELLAVQDAQGHWENNVYLTAIVVQAMSLVENDSEEDLQSVVNFDDSALHGVIAGVLSKNRSDSINKGELLPITGLDLKNSGASSLTGLEFATSLSSLTIDLGQALDLYKLTNLASLNQVNLKVQVFKNSSVSIPVSVSAAASNITAPANGTAVANGTTSIVYTPAVNYVGPDAFSYELSANGGILDVAVDVTVVESGDAIVAGTFNADSITVNNQLSVDNITATTLAPTNLNVPDLTVTSGINGAIGSDTPNTANFTSMQANSITLGGFTKNSWPSRRTRNYLINGNFDIWQRGTSFTGGSQYFADRWIAVHGIAGSISRETFTPGQTEALGGPRYFMRYTSGVSEYPRFGQRIENVLELSGKEITLSFWAKKGAAGDSDIAAIYLVQDAFASGARTDTALGGIALTTTWTKYTLTGTFPSVAGKTVGSNTYAGFEIYGQPWTHSGTLDIAQVQLEKGNAATEFEHISVNQELALCQRYYEKSYHIDTIPGTATEIGQVAQFGATPSPTARLTNIIRFMTPKRVPPNVTVWDVAGNINAVTYWGANDTQYQNSPFTRDHETQFSFRVYANGDTTTSRDGLSFQFTADAEF